VNQGLGCRGTGERQGKLQSGPKGRGGPGSARRAVALRRGLDSPRVLRRRGCQGVPASSLPRPFLVPSPSSVGWLGGGGEGSWWVLRTARSSSRYWRPTSTLSGSTARMTARPMARHFCAKRRGPEKRGTRSHDCACALSLSPSLPRLFALARSPAISAAGPSGVRVGHILGLPPAGRILVAGCDRGAPISTLILKAQTRTTFTCRAGCARKTMMTLPRFPNGTPTRIPYSPIYWPPLSLNYP
jgi:hypothetical protein